MTNAILEPTTIESSAPAEASTKVADVAPQPATPDTGIGRTNLDRLPKRETARSTAIQGRRRGLLSRSFHALRDTSFQVGFSLPGKLWYREYPVLNAKDRAVLDAAQQGFL